MGIFGGVIGGGIGMMLGGPLGAMLGAAMGSSMSGTATQIPLQTATRSTQELQLIFALALTSLAAKVAKADGKVTKEEIQTFDHFLSTALGLSKEDRAAASKVFNEARDSSTPTSEYTIQIRQLLATQPDRLRDIVKLLCAIAFADGEFHPAEEHIIREISGELGLSENDFQSCKATFRATHGSTTEDAYEVLGVPRTATDAEVKAAHRRLAKDYHPDILRSKGLADDFQEFARQKMTAINEAWETVKNERSL